MKRYSSLRRKLTALIAGGGIVYSGPRISDQAIS